MSMFLSCYPRNRYRLCPFIPATHRADRNVTAEIRYGLTDGLIDFERGEVVPARARIEALIEWVLPVADEIGAAPYLAVPEANAAERQYERVGELGSHRDVFAELVRRPRERVGG